MLRGFLSFALSVCLLVLSSMGVTAANQVHLHWFWDSEEYPRPRLESSISWEGPMTPWHTGAGTVILGHDFLRLEHARWRYQGVKNTLELAYGGTDWTSPDPWRMIHHSRFGAFSTSALFFADNSVIGFGQDLAGNGGIDVNAAWWSQTYEESTVAALLHYIPWQFSERHWQAGWGARISWDGERMAEKAAVNWAMLFSWDKNDIDGYLSKQANAGGAVSIQFQRQVFHGKWEWLYLAADARSPLAAYSSYPANRFGVRGQMSGKWSDLHWLFEFQDFQRMDGQREYLRHRWSLTHPFGRGSLVLDLRFAPNFYWSTEWRSGPMRLQWHQGNEYFRCQWNHKFGLSRVDVNTQRQLRWELRWVQQESFPWSGRWVHKVDWLNFRRAIHWSVQRHFRLGELSFEYGRYDRGSIANQWDPSPFASIRWTHHF